MNIKSEKENVWVERERVSEHDFDPHGWNTVSHRKRKLNPNASRTIVSSPLNFTISNLEAIFCPFGRILNTFTVQNVKPNWKHKFTFIQFANTNSMISAIQKNEWPKKWKLVHYSSVGKCSCYVSSSLSSSLGNQKQTLPISIIH